MSTEAAAPVSTPEGITPNPAPAAPVSNDPTLDTRLAAISKREREIQQQMAAFKQEKAGMVSKAELADLWKKDRSKVREYVGAAPEEWNFPDPPVDLNDPVTKLRQELDEMKQTAAQKEQERLTTSFKQGISDFVSKDAGAYELIGAYQATDTVFNFMVDYYNQNQKELGLKEACDYVENYLFSQLQKGTGTKKVGSLFQSSQTPGKQPSPTLTGAATANPSQSTSRRLTTEESVAQAAKLIKWI